MKIKQIADKSIDSFGGLYFFNRFIEKSNFEYVVESVLGERPAQAVYSYTDVLSSFAATCLAGGSYTEDPPLLLGKPQYSQTQEYFGYRLSILLL